MHFMPCARCGLCNKHELERSPLDSITRMSNEVWVQKGAPFAQKSLHIFKDITFREYCSCPSLLTAKNPENITGEYGVAPGHLEVKFPLEPLRHRARTHAPARSNCTYKFVAAAADLRLRFFSNVNVDIPALISYMLPVTLARGALASLHPCACSSLAVALYPSS